VRQSHHTPLPGYACGVDVPKHRNPRYVAILALAACLILIGGWLAQPRDIPESPPPLPSDTELAQLARRAERRSLDSMSNYFAESAGQVGSSVVYIPGARTSGIVWNAGLIVTAPLRSGAFEAVAVATKAAEGRAQTTVWGPHLPLTAVQSTGDLSGLVPARRLESPARPGEWVVAVWRTDREPAFAPGYFLQSAPVTCGVVAAREVVSSVALTRAMAGGGLFDIDGNLRAVILPCNDRFTAIAAPSIESMLRDAVRLDQRVLALYGLAVGALTDDEKTYFKASEGVIVREVWTDSLGDGAGLMPGDIVDALGGKAVVQLEDLGALATPVDQQPVKVTVRRGSKTLTITLQTGRDAIPEGAPAATTDAGLVWASPQEPYTIDRVLPNSRAAMAGIEPGDRLVRIDHAQPRSLAQVRRLLAGDRRAPVYLEIDRDGRRLGVLVR